MISTRVREAQLESIRFSSSVAAIGTLRCPAESGYFRGEQLTDNYVVAFPQAPLWIRQDRGRAFVATAALATMYNRAQRFERRAITADGDTAEWFAVDEEIAREIVARVDRRAAESPAPLQFTHVAVGPALYRAQRLVSRNLHCDEPGETEERAIAIFADVVALSYQSHGMLAHESTLDATPSNMARIDLVERAKSVLGASCFENLALREIARRCETSVYHLCRTFRAHTGQTLHGFRRDLRLRASLELLPDHRGSLSALAQHLGFSSHAHFSAAFKTQFGLAPAQWVRAIR